jgi:hypothetical protein
MVKYAPEQQGETVSSQHGGVEDVKDRDARAGAIVPDASNLWLERCDAGDYEETVEGRRRVSVGLYLFDLRFGVSGRKCRLGYYAQSHCDIE